MRRIIVRAIGIMTAAMIRSGTVKDPLDKFISAFRNIRLTVVLNRSYVMIEMMGEIFFKRKLMKTDTDYCHLYVQGNCSL